MMLNKTFYLLLLSLIPIFGFSQANSQYPDSGNKIRLGFQTSGDGLIWRDTQPKAGGYRPINNKAAWIILDTMNNKFYHYKNSTWILAGGQDIDTANLIATKYNLGFKLSLADTQNMLTPYWRSGRFSGVLPVENGGTGQSTLAAAGINTGSGTLNYLPKYTATGTTLGNSIIFNNDNNVGIGTASPNAKLEVNSGTILNYKPAINSNAIYASANNSYSWQFGINNGTDFVITGGGFASLGTERMRITSGGNVGIGTTSPNTYKLQVDGAAGIVSSANAAIEFGIRTPDATYNDSYLIFGTATNNRAQIQVTGSAANTGNMVFTTYNAGVGAERMRITSGGNVIINSLTTNGIVYSNAGTLTNTNPSDSTLKNSINPYTYGLSEILQLKPKTFYYNLDVTRSHLKYGFIAQEVQSIMPNLVRIIGNGSDKLGLESEGIYVAMVNAIKELSAEIDILKQEIINLKNK